MQQLFCDLCRLWRAPLHGHPLNSNTLFITDTLLFPWGKKPFHFLSTGHFWVPPEPLYQNEVKCSAFDMEMIFHSHANKTHFHKVVHLASFWKWGFLELGSGLFNPLNPLSPSSDQDQFSPNKIHTLSIDKLWELIKWSPERNALIYHQILSTNSLRKCMEISLENLYVDSGA